MALLLLSHFIDSSTPTYGNRDKFFADEVSDIAKGASANSSKWIFETNHLGTHIDMPRHFFEDGKTLTDFSTDFWISEKVQIVVVPCEEAKLITPTDLKETIQDNIDTLIIKTNFEKFRGSGKYWNDNPGLSEEFGFWIRKNKPEIKMVGFDFISLTSWKYRAEGKLAHKAFLTSEGEGNPVCIIEDMALKNCPPSIKKLIVAPVFVKNANGSPVTIFAEV